MIVVLSFPYDPQIVAVVRAIPQRRFDWDKREWWAPVDDWAGVHVAEVLERFPELTTSAQVDAWLAAIERRWVGRVSTTRHDGRGWWVLRTRAGTVPEPLLEGAVEREDGAAAGAAHGGRRRGARRARGARASTAARAAAWPRSSAARSRPPRAWPSARPSTGPSCASTSLWDPDVAAAFDALPGAGHPGHTLPIDPWVVEALDAFLALHDVTVDGAGQGDARRAARRVRRGAEPRSAPRARRAPSRSPRPPPCSAASSRPSSGRACATRCARGAPSSPTSRAWARPSRRWRRSRPTTPSRPSSSAPRR